MSGPPLAATQTDNSSPPIANYHTDHTTHNKISDHKIIFPDERVRNLKPTRASLPTTRSTTYIQYRVVLAKFSRHPKGVPGPGFLPSPASTHLQIPVILDELVLVTELGRIYQVEESPQLLKIKKRGGVRIAGLGSKLQGQRAV